MKHVIHIFGPSGSGTTTLAKKISENLGYTFMDTDDYFWMPTDPKFTTKRPKEERLAMMTADIERAENVVLSGSLADWGDVLIPYFTLAVRLYLEPTERIARLRHRERERFGARVLPGGDMYESHEAFITWAKSYETGGLDQRSKAKHDAWQTLLPCALLQLDSSASPDVLFERVKAVLDRMA